MEQIPLDVQLRNETGKRHVRKMRRENLVPGVVYGEGENALPVGLDRKILEKIRRQHHGENIIFQLSVFSGEKKVKNYTVMVKEEQLDPVTEKVIHIDFNRISLTKKVEVRVPVVAKGEPVGVKRDGGSLEHVIWELDVVCLPTEIPDHLDVDVSALEIAQNIHVRDIVLPGGVVTKHDPEAIVLTVAPPMKEEVEKPEEMITEPEVIKEKKEPKEGEEEKKPAAEARKEEKKEEKKEK